MKLRFVDHVILAASQEHLSGYYSFAAAGGVVICRQ